MIVGEIEVEELEHELKLRQGCAKGELLKLVKEGEVELGLNWG